MRIHLVAAGTKMPDWISAGYSEYAKRMPIECSLHLLEIPLGKRSKGQDSHKAIAEEGIRMLNAIPKGAGVVALDIDGRNFSTMELATELSKRLASSRDLALLVGGPDGLATACLERADTRWSLSRLTFPHALVRVIVAEQLYRAWSLLQGHPYHRENK